MPGSNWPSVDEFILNDLPRNIYSNKNEKINAAQSVIFGFNSLDSVIAYPWHTGPSPSNETEYKQFISKYISNKTQQNLIQNVYIEWN